MQIKYNNKHNNSWLYISYFILVIPKPSTREQIEVGWRMKQSWGRAQ